MTHKFKANPDQGSRFWMLDALPSGSNVWVYKTNLVCGEELFHSWQPFPSGITIRVITSGTWTVNMTDTTNTLKRGDIFIAIPGTLVEFFVTEKAPWEWYEIQFNGPDAISILSAFGCSKIKPARTPDNPKETIRYFKKIHEYMHDENRSPWIMLSMLFQLINHCNSKSEIKTSKSTSKDLIVNRVIDMVESTPAINKNVSELASDLNIDRTTLCRIFKERMGTTPIDFIKQIRMERAVEMLNQTEQSVKVIAQSTGFSNEKYFIRCFREKMGLPPRKWKKLKADSQLKKDVE